MERMPVFGKRCLGMSCSAVGPEFNVNESIMYIKQGVFKRKHQVKQGCGLTSRVKMLGPEARRNPTLYFSWEQWFPC